MTKLLKVSKKIMPYLRYKKGILFAIIKRPIQHFFQKRGYEFIKINELNKRVDYFKNVLIENKKNIKEYKRI